MEIILDNIRSALNIGSIFRSADAFAVKCIYLCGISATPPNKEILKTALGATETVRWEHHHDTSTLLRELSKDENVLLVALEQTKQSLPLDTFTPPTGKRIVLVLGNEVDGVSKEALECCTVALEIPQFGAKKSLNVAVAAGIALWEMRGRDRKLRNEEMKE